MAVGGGRGELRRMLCRERFRTYGRGSKFALETTLSGTVARRRMVGLLVVVGLKAGWTVNLGADAEGIDVEFDDGVVVAVVVVGVVAFAVSAAEKEKAFVSLLFSTGPADSGGVAVMVLGNRKSCSPATAGEMGCAVRGVSGNNVEANGVCAPC